MKKRPLPQDRKEECLRLKAIFTSKKKELGLTQERLAHLLDMNQSSVSHYLNGVNPLNTGVAAAFSRILQVPVSSFSTRLAEEIDALAMVAQGATSNVEPGPPITTAPRRIEIMGTAQLGNDGYWVGLDNSDGWVETWTRDEDAYALRLKGDSMAPAIRNGWVAVCEPNHRLVPGEYVMVTTTDGQSMVKELLFESEDGVSVMSVNSAYERRNIAWTDIDKIHYVGAILGPSKVMCRL
ncbi:helix-turn-helix domain-containing protein [Pseudomonas sp. p1(2021b)]|uniref:LexA family transcriptional regulator n=1 Tax=Pseudomonas sp. p1(2021b) TaxID=2874628 RepID=UPI001CCBCE9D|nr:S24 family peptidase [Pseudomonas sp. p1(2021b)]UBM23328.1 helix-turn-helix domain-containing protein [Pseudomonas sp. p1(2021b)]